MTAAKNTTAPLPRSSNSKRCVPFLCLLVSHQYFVCLRHTSRPSVEPNASPGIEADIELNTQLQQHTHNTLQHTRTQGDSSDAAMDLDAEPPPGIKFNINTHFTLRVLSMMQGDSEDMDLDAEPPPTGIENPNRPLRGTRQSLNNQQYTHTHITRRVTVKTWT